MVLTQSHQLTMNRTNLINNTYPIISLFYLVNIQYIGYPILYNIYYIMHIIISIIRYLITYIVINVTTFKIFLNIL